ncbi:MAG TPA: DUF2325 domain-containing protein [Polyangiaceae bacterium]|jgi:hypothetical protein|nr:DUF2325 domain-containing protein [Polyangiaceae bacterium]
MHIGIVGGVDRGEELFRQIAAHQGVELDFHVGDLAGRGGATLDALVDRSDVVVVVTSVNSHAAVWRARKQAKRLGRRVLLVSHFGVAKFTALLRELVGQSQYPAATGGARR